MAGNSSKLPISCLCNYYEFKCTIPTIATTTTSSLFATFKADSNDIPQITGVHDFFREFYSEFKKLWYLAGPAIFTSICQYFLSGITQLFCGHMISTIAQAAFSVEDYVLGLLSYGAMRGSRDFGGQPNCGSVDRLDGEPFCGSNEYLGGEFVCVTGFGSYEPYGETRENSVV
ncbi:hypothetical protein EZV62_017542 [Acer yangbiense]|uniref:Uncharacterized protein n=1 Tax=Acer yangbiense TaxID=1000413 RepID=A0A5C7HHA0_9ROSI|nr:hypothetical protein EZV62_017542 [Acer yangbiense]